MAFIAGQNLDTISHRDTQQTTARRWVHNVGKKISLFVNGVKDKVNLKLIAAKGHANLWAQSGNVKITGDQSLRITASKGKFTAVAKEELLIACGGAYIRLKDGNIEFVAPQPISVKASNYSRSGPTSMDMPLPVFPVSEGSQLPGRFTIRPQAQSGQTYAGKPYKLELGGKTYEGKIPGSGIINEELPDGVTTGKLLVYPYGKDNAPVEWPLDVKSQQDYTEAQGLQSKLKNLGFYDGSVDGDVGKVSESAIRRFRELLNHSGDSEIEQPGAASGKHDI
jgi:type VI secretion system secreted protein VgrG